MKIAVLWSGWGSPGGEVLGDRCVEDCETSLDLLKASKFNRLQVIKNVLEVQGMEVGEQTLEAEAEREAEAGNAGT